MSSTDTSSLLSTGFPGGSGNSLSASNAVEKEIIQGAVPENNPAAGNPILIGGRYDASSRILGDGDAGAIALNSSGQAMVEIASGNLGTEFNKGATASGTHAGSISLVQAVSSLPTLTNNEYANQYVNTTGELHVTDSTMNNAVSTPGSSISSAGILMTGSQSGTARVVATDSDGHLQVDVLSGGGGGTQYTNADATDVSSGIGTLMLGENPSNNPKAIATDADGAVHISDGGNTITVDGTVLLSSEYVDDADWTASTSLHSLIGGVYQSTPGTITDGDTGPIRLSQNGAIHISDGGTAINVDGSGVTQPVTVGTALPAGDNNIGNVDIASALPPGTNAIGKVYANTIKDGSGTDYVPLVDDDGHLQVDILSGGGGGTQYTLGSETYTEANSVGTIAAAVRQNTLTSLGNSNNEIVPLQVNEFGALQTANSGVQSSNNTSTTNVGGQTTINEGAEFGSGDTTLTVTDASVFDNNTTIKIGSEYLSITFINSNDLTVTRGAFNSTPAAHANGSTVTGVYIGASEQNNYADITASLKSDTAGILYFDFSNDDTLWDTYPVSGFTVAANVHKYHTAVKNARYFRVRFENGSSSKTTSFRVYTYFGDFKLGKLPLNQSIGSDQDSMVVRAVAVGEDPLGSYLNTKQDGSAFRTTTNLAGSTLSSGITSSNSISIPLNAHTALFPPSGYIYIGSEFIAYNSYDMIGVITGGSGYTNGTYTNVSTTGGTGSGMTLDITVSGEAVTAATVNTFGGGYADGDSIVPDSDTLGGGSSASIALVDDTSGMTATERGAFGTTAASHSSSDVVGQAYNSGVLTLDGYTEVATKILSSTTGQRRFQWYSDSSGTNIIRTLALAYPPSGGTVGTYDYLAAPSFGPYVRYVFGNTDTSGAATTNFYYETDFYTKSISAQVLTVNSTISGAMTANLTRSVQVGKQPDGDYVNVPADGSGFLTTSNLLGSATLNGSITNVATSITVNTDPGYSDNDYIRIEDEYLQITDVSSTPTLTVTRGQLGSTGASHSDAIAVYHTYVSNTPSGNVGDFLDTDGYNAISIFIASDQVSLTSGIVIQFTDDSQASPPVVRGNRTYSYNSSNVTDGQRILSDTTLLDGFRLLYTNGATATTNFIIEATLKTNANENKTQLNETLQADTDVTDVRAVIAGAQENGNYSNVGIDSEANLKVSLGNTLTAFDEQSIQQLEPIEALKFVYGLPSNVDNFTSYGTYLTVGTEGAVGVAQVQSIYLPKNDSFTRGGLAGSGTADYFTIQDGGSADFYVWFNDDNTADPAIPVHTAIQVNIFGWTITTAGAGYTDGAYTNVATTGGSGSGLTLDVTITSGAVANIALNTAGSGYSATDTVALDTGTVGTPITPTVITIDDYASTPSEIASAAQSAIDLDPSFSATVFGSIVTITNAVTGVATSIDAQNMPLTSNSSITSTKGTGIASITNGAGVADYAVLRAERQIRYAPGLGIIARIAPIFGTAKANIDQYAGVGNSTNAIYVGYSGTTFQISHRYNGIHALHTMQITDVSGAGTGTVTVKVDGVDFEITLTDVGSVQSVAQQIADQDYRTALYLTDIVDDTVYFLSERIANTGNNTFSFTLGSATNITVVSTQVTVATDSTKDSITQSNFNIDTLDGNGPSGMTLVPTNGNVFQIQYPFMGFGNIKFFIKSQNGGKFIPFHEIRYTNQNTVPMFNQPDMQLTAFTTSTLATESNTIQLISAAAFREGKELYTEPYYVEDNTHTAINSATTNNILFAIKNPRIFNGITNQVTAILKQYTLSSTKSANNTKATATLKIAIGGTPSSDLVFTFKDDGNSPIATAKPSAGTQLTGFNSVIQATVSAEGNDSEFLLDQNITLQKNQTLYVVYSNTAPSAGDIDISSSLSWISLQ